jgi:benzoyl-CoA reductase/2-hydroxyglutaryl-CoA dehydratase subunit BcrC/BadD/HgdB
MTVSAIEPFVTAVEEHDERLATLSSAGTKIIGYFCTYTPVEMIHAAGFLPVRVLGGTGPVKHADALVPTFVCPYMRLALDKALARRRAYLSGIVQSYTCDVACGLVRIWQENVPGELFHSVPLPYNDSPDARRFFRAALIELADSLNRIGGSFTQDALTASICLYEDVRAALRDLFRLRAENRLEVSAAELLTVVLAGFVTRPEEYRVMLRDLAGKIPPVPDARSGIPVLVSGSVLEDPAILTVIESAGGRVAGDDLCTGLRSVQPIEGDSGDPVARLMDRTFRRIPCPARSRAEERLPRILDLVNLSSARGVIFLLQKFCTPHLADHPALVEGLRERGVPSVLVEMDEAGADEGRLKTRVEAVFEMLGA